MAFLGMASPLRLHSDELLFFFDISLKETRQCDDFLYTEFFIILPTNYPTFTILSQVPYLSKHNIFCWSVSAIVTRGRESCTSRRKTASTVLSHSFCGLSSYVCVKRIRLLNLQAKSIKDCPTISQSRISSSIIFQI